MDSNKINLMWAISLMVICVVTIIRAVANITGIEILGFVRVVLSLIYLIALPFLLFSSIKKIKNKN